MKYIEAIDSGDNDLMQALDAALGDMIERHGVRHVLGIMAGKVTHLLEFTSLEDIDNG